jgi:hypothetical protein
MGGGESPKSSQKDSIIIAPKLNDYFYGRETFGISTSTKKAIRHAKSEMINPVILNYNSNRNLKEQENREGKI